MFVAFASQNCGSYGLMYPDRFAIVALFAGVAAPSESAGGEVREIIARTWTTAIAVVVAFIAWRLAIAAVDRAFARRFVSRFIPRIQTFKSLSKSLAGVVILIALALILLNIWAVNVTPAVWSAGIVTAALAFGAQALIRDILTGFFFLFEDQYDVGDAVELTTTTNAVISGTVDSVGLRTTRLVDERGRTHNIAHGNILFITNASRLPSRASVTVKLPLCAPVGEMRSRIADLARAEAGAAGLTDGAVDVSLEDVLPEAATFRIEFAAARGDAALVQARLRERIASGLQAVGWLPRAAAAANDA